MTLRILIVDDDPAFRTLLERRLRSFIREMELVTLEDLASTRRYLAENRAESIDLLILDEHLPDGRGIELLCDGSFNNLAVLSVSSDAAPEIPGAAIQAGATYFLSKTSIGQPLFEPLVRGVIDRNRLQRKLAKVMVDSAVIESVKTLVATLRHEINNPLGAVLGAAYLLSKTGDADQRQAAELVDSSGRRIKHVLDQLCETVEIESVTKSNQKVFHIPGDKPWEEGTALTDTQPAAPASKRQFEKDPLPPKGGKK